MFEEMQKTSELLHRVCVSLERVATSTSHCELRQCQSIVAGSEASRVIDSWARGASAFVQEVQFVEIVERVLEYKTIRAMNYYWLFSEQDRRRAEALGVFFMSIESGAIGKSKFEAPEYHEIAVLAPLMPSCRRKLELVAQKLGKSIEFFLPPIPDGLGSLLKLMVPIGTDLMPIEPVSPMSTDEFDELFQRIPKPHRDFLEKCMSSGLLRGPPRAQITKAVACWANLRGEVGQKQAEIDKYNKKKRKLEQKSMASDDSQEMSMDENKRWLKLLGVATEFAESKYPEMARVSRCHREMLLDKALSHPEMRVVGGGSKRDENSAMAESSDDEFREVGMLDVSSGRVTSRMALTSADS